MNPGDVFVVKYPFVRCDVELWDGELSYTKKSWRPGCEFDYDYSGGSSAYADGVGEMHLTVVSTHKPGKYPERIFYTRKFKDPDGAFFGKTKLHIATVEKFRRISASYREEYALANDEEDVE